MRKSLSSILSGAMLLSMLVAFPAFAGWDEGVAAFTSKNFQTAAQEFQELVQQNPEGWRGYYMLGLSLEQLKRKEEALHNLRKAYDLNPNDLAVKMALGRGYSNMRRYKEVTSLLASVDASSLPAKQQAAFYQLRGQARFKTDDSRAAVADFEQLAKLRPQDAKTQYLFGTTALKSGRLDAGIVALGKAVGLAPKDPEMKRAYAQALIKKGRMTRDKTEKKRTYLKAAGVAKGLVGIEPSYDNLMLQVAAQLGGSDYKGAIDSGKAALAKNSNDWLAHFYVGQAYSSDKQYKAAEAPLKDAQKLTNAPGDVKQIWRQLGYVYEKQKKYADSIDGYTRAGDQAGVERVTKNEETDRFNKDVEAENTRIKQMEEEAKKLEAELKALEEGGGGVR